MPTSNLSAFFVQALGSEMQFYYYNQANLTIVIFSHFDVYFIEDIGSLLFFQIFNFNGLGDTLYYYTVPSTILNSVSYFNIFIYQGILEKVELTFKLSDTMGP